MKMTKDGKYGVGIFGIGWVAGEHIKAYLNNPRCEIVALASRRRESAESKKAELNLDCDILDTYDDLIARDDIDIISMCSPNFLRAEEIVKACEAGKHFFAEKPVAHSLDELKAIQTAYEKARKKHDIKTICGFSILYYNQYLCIESMIEKGALGDIFLVETDYWHELGPWWHGWTWGCYTKKGGPSTSLLGGVHAVSALLKIGGDSFEIESPYYFNIIVHGSKGSILNDKFFTKEVFAGQEGYQDFNCTLMNSGEVSHHPFSAIVDAFVEDIEHNVDSKLRLEFTIKVHEVCLAIDTSAATGKVIKLPLL
jgi:predicted dehydrogenase